MNRRNAIGNIALFSIGALVLPSCVQKDDGLVKLKNLSLTGSEEKMLIQLGETILPKTAAELKSHEFTLIMVDDCYEPEKQKKFTAGLKEFDKLAKSKYGSPFISCTPPQKTEWLTAIEKKKDIPEDALFFYETTKRHTVQAFTSSEKYMTEVIKYNMVPGGNFKGCVPVKKA